MDEVIKMCSNVEEIINALEPLTQYIKSFRKIDGITIECESISLKFKDNAKNEVQALSKNLKLIPVSVQDSKLDEMLFAVQYPEFIPYYNSELVEKMYRDNFKFLIDNIKMKDPASATKSVLYENMDSITKHSITIYCKSNINMYKESVNDYLNDKKYRSMVNSIFVTFVEDYLSGNIK